MTDSFSGLEDLRKEHLRLLRSWRTRGAGSVDAKIEHLWSFIRRVVATGAELAADQDRELAQNILDHWVAHLAIIAPAVSTADLPQSLAPYSPKDGPDSSASATEQAEAARDAREQLRLTALARQWLESGQDSGYLVNGRAVKNARKFQNKDILLSEFVDASSRYEFRRLIRLVTVGVLVGVAVVVPPFIVYGKVQSIFAERIETENVRLRAALDRADSCSSAFLKAQDLAEVVSATPRCDLDQSVKDALTVFGVTANQVVAAPSKPLPSVDKLTRGAIWLGSESALKVSGEDGGTLIAANITPGTYVRAKTTLTLRSELPGPSGELAAGKGVVPRGTLAKILRKSTPINGQLFAEVEYESAQGPTVFFQFTGLDRKKADEFRRALGDRGYVVPGAELMKFKIENSVKYDADCAQINGTGIATQAEQLRKDAGDVLASLGFSPEPLMLKSINYNCKFSNTLELWIDFGTGQ